MKVKITNGDGWYSDKVGEVLEVYESDCNFREIYCLMEDKNHVEQRYIEKPDCEIIKELTSEEKVKTLQVIIEKS